MVIVIHRQARVLGLCTVWSLAVVLFACTPPTGNVGQNASVTSPAAGPEFWQASGPHTQGGQPGQFHEVRRLQFTGDRVLVETWLSLDQCKTPLVRVQDKGVVSRRVQGQRVELKLTSREVSLLVAEAPEGLAERFPEALGAWQRKLPWTEDKERAVNLVFRAAPGSGADGPASEGGLLCPEGATDSVTDWECYWTGKDADLVPCGKGALEQAPLDSAK